MLTSPPKSVTKSIIRTMEMNGTLNSFPIKISETPKTKSIAMEDGEDNNEEDEEKDEEEEIKEVKKGKPHNYYCSHLRCSHIKNCVENFCRRNSDIKKIYKYIYIFKQILQHV